MQDSTTIPTKSNKTSISEVVSFLNTTHNPTISPRKITVFTSKNWEYEILQSVSKCLFEPLTIKENLAPKTNTNRPGDIHNKVYICFHDTGSHFYNAGEWSNIVKSQNKNGTLYEASYQYVVGNDGTYHNIPDNETAYHAGDGHCNESLFKIYVTGIYGDEGDPLPIVDINQQGYYTLNGHTTKILAPTDQEGKILSKKDFNDMGVFVILGNCLDNENNEFKNQDGLIEINDEEFEKIFIDKDRNLQEKNNESDKNTKLMYFIGKTYFNKTYKLISNKGGNMNSIGIESCVNVNSDVHLTWQKTCKLVAYLMDTNHLGFDRIKQHHYFSGKNCPQTIRTASLWDYILDLIKSELQMKKYMDEGFKFEFQSLNLDYVDYRGRVLKRPQGDNVTVSYSVKVTDNEGNSTTNVFTTTIPGY